MAELYLPEPHDVPIPSGHQRSEGTLNRDDGSLDTIRTPEVGQYLLRFIHGLKTLSSRLAAVRTMPQQRLPIP